MKSVSGWRFAPPCSAPGSQSTRLPQERQPFAFRYNGAHSVALQASRALHLRGNCLVNQGSRVSCAELRLQPISSCASARERLFGACSLQQANRVARGF